MSYTTYFLRFTSKTKMNNEFKKVDYYKTDENDNTYYSVYPATGDIDVVGEIYNNDAVYDEEGNVISEATKKDGYHVNVILKEPLPESLESFVVQPANPYRVFAS
jgi:hypothetical protein